LIVRGVWLKKERSWWAICFGINKELGQFLTAALAAVRNWPSLQPI